MVGAPAVAQHVSGLLLGGAVVLAVAIGFLIGIIAAIVIQVIGRLIVRRNAMARAAASPMRIAPSTCW